MAVVLPDQEARRTWSAVLDRARTELPETTFLMWFTDVRPIGLHDEVLSLAVPSQFVRERLQHNHLGLIEQAAGEAQLPGRCLYLDTYRRSVSGDSRLLSLGCDQRFHVLR